jgi:hypothetical protein
MNLVVSLVAIILGALIAASPAQAARIWGSEELEKLAPPQKTVFVRWFRALGILICLGGILSAIDTIGFSNYRH